MVYRSPNKTGRARLLEILHGGTIKELKRIERTHYNLDVMINAKEKGRRGGSG